MAVPMMLELVLESTFAAEDFSLSTGEAPFDLIVAVRVGAFDGRHPEAGARAWPRLAAALVPGGCVVVDGVANALDGRRVRSGWHATGRNHPLRDARRVVRHGLAIVMRLNADRQLPSKATQCAQSSSLLFSYLVG
jgi:hypothetical protein